MIEKFIIENLPSIQEENIEEEYAAYMNAEKQKAFEQFTQDEKVNPEKLRKLTENYLFTQRTPKKEEVIEMLEEQPSILQRAKVGDTILAKFLNFIDTFFKD